MVEGINEKGLSAGLFYFLNYGKYEPYEASLKDKCLADFQVVSYVLAECSTTDEVKEALSKVRIINIDPRSSTVHWRFTEPSGKQIVLEVVNEVMHFYDNPLGVLTNSPGIEWHWTNLSNYINLQPGNAPEHNFGPIEMKSLGHGSGMLGLPGDFTPPSRFVRATFFQLTAPQQPEAQKSVFQAFHILNNFDIPTGTELPWGKASADMPSATQFTVASDTHNRMIYYRTMYNSNIRCIDLKRIDFAKVKYHSRALDEIKNQPVEMITIR
jgi:choloylglycine hydrolase